MKHKNRFLRIGTLFVIFLVLACGGSNQQKANKQSEMPAEHGAMTSQNPEDNTTDMHQQHNSLAENFSHKDVVVKEEL